jgi:hypothetical protein
MPSTPHSKRASEVTRHKASQLTLNAAPISDALIGLDLSAG